MSARTVRDVLRENLQDETLHGEELLDAILRDLRSVLSTGDGWVPRAIAARLLEGGDVVAAKDGRLWGVEWVQETGRDPEVVLHLRRGERQATKRFGLEDPVPTLVTRTDQRALDLLAAELGAELVAREVA